MKNAIWLKDWNLLVDNLPEDKQLLLFNLFRNYEIDLDCDDIAVKPIWLFIRSQLNNMNEKYEQNIVNRNKINGLKGGRPKTQITQKNPMGYLETQKTLNNNNNNNNNNNIYENLQTFLNYRQIEFDKLSEQTKMSLANYGITKPKVRNTNMLNNQYVDCVGIILEAYNDLEWRRSICVNLSITESDFIIYFDKFIKQWYIPDESKNYDILGFKSHFQNVARILKSK